MMFRRLLPYAAALAVAIPTVAFAATGPADAPAMVQTVDWHDNGNGAPPPPWLLDQGDGHDHGHDHGHDRHDRDSRGHWVRAHVEWHHHHRVWVPGHWERT